MGSWEVEVGIVCHLANCNCNCNCNVEFVKRAKILLTVKNSHEGASSNVFRLIGDTNMFSVLSRIHDTTSTNHEGPSQHYSSPADQLSQKLAVQSFVHDAGISNPHAPPIVGGDDLHP